MSEEEFTALRALYASTWLDLPNGDSIDLARPVGREELEKLAAAALPERFVVITAHESHARRRDEAHDLQRENQLHALLARLGKPVARVVGRSPDGAHQERSFAVDLPVDASLEIARQFSQHAVFAFDGRAFAIHWTQGRESTRLPLKP